MPESDRGAEFSPSELDLLEDALEDPELLPDGASPALRDRLESYRAILGIADEALPMVEVPDGLLAGVLAEAANSPANTPEIAASPGLWERLRRSFVVPGFALAATAVLLIVVLRPNDADLGDMSEVAEATKSAPEVEEGAPARPAASEPKREEVISAAALSEDGDASAAPKEDAKAEADDAVEAEAEPLPATKAAPKPERAKSKKSAKADMPAPASAGGSVDPLDGLAEEKVDADDKDALRSLLQQADSDRQRGRCSDATAAYKKLLGTKGNEEARALMGLGLCAEASGDDNAATDYYRRAKAINPALDSLITSERKKLAVPQDSKKSSKKSKPKSKVPSFE